MADEARLTTEHADHEPVTELIDIITYCTEAVSLDFDRWDDPYVRVPGLYFVVVAGTSIAGYADSMGDDRWPTDDCRQVDADHDAFFETARTVAREHDGAVVVATDGTLHERMVLSRISRPRGWRHWTSTHSTTPSEWAPATRALSMRRPARR